ncbi:MAG: fused MFS/spermidine synthase, partial [Deltaproteobacteria bacterium]|nr:fused MFS/spermidine synthase [Deltaproteobacteria bacterium]
MTQQGALLRLFFLSGASGLLYQVLWIRIFTSILGGTTQSMSAVVSAFMLGMAAGSYIFGRIADRTPAAVRLYGLLELAAGAAAALAFVLFIATSAFGEALYGVVPYGVYQWLLFGVAFVFVSVPAAFLGGMLPPLIRQLTTTEESLRPVLSSLYAANSLGAAFGAMGCILLVSYFGYLGAYAVAIGLSVAVGIMALRIGRALPKRPGHADVAAPDDAAAPEPAAPEPAAPRFEFDRSPEHGRAVLFAIAVSGFSALGFEVVWFRLSGLLLRGTLGGFGVILAVYLIGLSLGSAWVARVSDRRAGTALVTIEVALAVATALSLPLFALGQEVLLSRAPGIAWALALLFIVTFLYGATFPLASRLFIGSGLGKLGQSVGTVYAVNVLGAICGSLITGFVFIPILGTQTALYVLVAFNVASALSLLPFVRRPRRRVTLAVAIAFAFLLGVFLEGGPWDRRLVQSVIPPDRGELIELVDSELQMLSVFERPDGERILHGGPFISGATVAIRRQTQRLQGHLPMLVHPNPKRVLEIGYGVGEIARVISLHDPDRIDLVEIDPEMTDIADRYFGRINGRVSERANVQVHPMDGRHFLQMTDDRFDVIMSDSMILESEASFRLYTQEHFVAGREHLAPGGIMALWLPLEVAGDTSRTILRTFVEVFPETLAWMPTGEPGHEVFLLGFRDEATVDAEELARRFERYAKADLAPLGCDIPACFLAGFRAGPADLPELYGDIPYVNRDMWPVADFVNSGDPEAMRRRFVDGRPSDQGRWLHGADGFTYLDRFLEAESLSREACDTLETEPFESWPAHRAEWVASFEQVEERYPRHATSRRCWARLLITLAELDGSRGAGALTDAQSAYELDPYSFRANLYLAEDALSRRDEAA